MINKIIRAVILIGLCLILIHILFSASANKIINPSQAAAKVKDTVSRYFVPNKEITFSGGVSEESGLYKVNLNIDNNPQPFYLTKDAALLVFPGGLINIADFAKTAVKQQPAAQEIPKADKPKVELFVMSLCPYGVKAEREILPVVNKFKDKIDFKIKYIVRVKGDSIDQVDSLHGINEVKENLRQAAIMQYYPDKFNGYIDKIEQKSCVISCGELKLDDYWQKAAKEMQMDTKKIESFVLAKEGMSLLRQDQADMEKYGVNASPTLVINGVKSNAVSQGIGAIEQAICLAFTDPSNCK